MAVFSFEDLFHKETIDVKKRWGLKGKLSECASDLGIYVDYSRLHEAGYDVFLTREIYKKLSNG